MISEIYPTTLRGRAMSIPSGAHWFFNGIVSRLDPKTEQWKTWTLNLDKGMVAGVHDLSFGSDHNLMTDSSGLVWYSEIAHNAVGWFDPKTRLAAAGWVGGGAMLGRVGLSRTCRAGR